MAKSIYWYDFETFGKDPKRDRASQFAGIRTDEDFNTWGIDLPFNAITRNRIGYEVDDTSDSLWAMYNLSRTFSNLNAVYIIHGR